MTAGPSASTVLGLLGRVALVVALVIGASELGEVISARFDAHLTPSTEPAIHRSIMIAIVIYVLLMTLPFVPGAEIGLSLMMLFGAKIVPLVYAATLLALSAAFLVGRLVPQPLIVRGLERLRLHRAADLLRDIEAMDAAERPRVLLERAPARWVPFLLRNRHLALALILNVPGNAVIGGGGGIGLVAGFSRLFTFPHYLLAVALGVAPVPLLVLWTGG